MIRSRLQSELKILETNKKLLSYIEKAPVADKNAVPLSEVLAHEEYSVVGLLLGKLRYRIPTVARQPSDVAARLEVLRKVGLGSVSEKQMEELILHGIFGDPEKALREYAAATGSEELAGRLATPGFDYVQALRQRLHMNPELELQDLPSAVGLPADYQVSLYEDYLSPLSNGRLLLVAGIMLREPKQIVTKPKNDRPGRPMAFLNLKPLGQELDEFDEPVFKVTVWPDGMHKLKEITPHLVEGDVVLILGRREWNDYKDEPGLTIGESPNEQILPYRPHTITRGKETGTPSS